MPHHSFPLRRSALVRLAPPALLGAALVAATAAAPVPAPAAPRPLPAPHAQAGFAWSPVQVRALIDAIRAARHAGLDPADYGLAALRAELDLCEQLWNTAGSRQLDTLARAAALALANDYRHQAAAAPVRPAELDAALSAGRVGPWLAAQAPRPAGGIS